MSDLWTPPPGFFPDAVTWFHKGNISRFQPIFRADSECNFTNGDKAIRNFVPGCDGSAIGLPVHFWKYPPPTEAHWGLITGCTDDFYITDIIEDHDIYDIKCTIGTGVLATLSDFFRGAQIPAPYGSAVAIRYGWCFSDELLEWWTHTGLVMHWLGPA